MRPLTSALAATLLSVALPSLPQHAQASTGVLRCQMPIMQAMMSTLVERVLDRVCAEKKCTPAQRKQLDQVMGQMMGRSKS